MEKPELPFTPMMLTTFCKHEYKQINCKKCNEGKTLIETCGTCEHWEKTTTVPEIKKVYGICHNENAKEEFWAGIEPPSTSGCIHYEEKKDD